MRRILALTAALVLVPTAAATPPRKGVFVPGKSLGGLRIGMTEGQVLESWRHRHGVCRGCPQKTWYFNYAPFTPQGAGVVLRHGRVIHVFTVWRPSGWRTPEGVQLGDDPSEVSRLYGSLDRRECTGYHALLKPGKRVNSVFYVFRDKLWGFGLTLPNESPCL